MRPLTPAQADTLRRLQATPQPSLRELAAVYGITVHAVWCRVKGLIQKGYVKRLRPHCARALTIVERT